MWWRLRRRSAAPARCTASGTGEARGSFREPRTLVRGRSRCRGAAPARAGCRCYPVGEERGARPAGPRRLRTSQRCSARCPSAGTALPWHSCWPGRRGECGAAWALGASVVARRIALPPSHLQIYLSMHKQTGRFGFSSLGQSRE